jgi:hypothetical protein
MPVNTANFEDIYPLTPFQQGMLFHVLDTPKAGMYLNQQRYTLRGELDLPAFKRALQAVMNRHQILRTAFLLSGMDGPHQVVYRELELRWVMHDWSELSPAETSERVEEFLRSDYQSGFDVRRAPLNRATLIRTGPDLYEFIWSFHLLLMDGWSMQVMLRELLALYHSYCTGQAVDLGQPLPYREFIKWLQRQPLDQAEVYWRETLKGFTSPTPLVFDRTPPADVAERPDFKEKIVLMDESTSDSLRAFALQHRVTLNTLVQGAWALLLSRRSGTNDVIFGCAVSGRSAPIPKIDSAVGIFVNVLPVRVLVPVNGQVVTWLRELQKQQAEARRFEFCSIAGIHGWSDVPRNQPLFESVMVFQNFPNGVALPESAGIEMIGVALIERSNVPLALVVEPASRLHLRIVYMGAQFEDATIDEMLEKLPRILIELTTNPDAALSSISYQVDDERRLLIDSFNQSFGSL